MTISSYDEALAHLERVAEHLGGAQPFRVRRDTAAGGGGGDNMGVTNLDIRDAILQLLNVIRSGNNKMEKHSFSDKKMSERILQKLESSSASSATDKKIDNISTFLLRMNAKLESIERRVKRGGRGGRGGGGDILETLAQESFDILTLLPTYIENTKEAVTEMATKSDEKFERVEGLLTGGDDGEGESLASVVRTTEANILDASRELKSIVIESGEMAESLFERVNDGYKDLTVGSNESRQVLTHFPVIIIAEGDQGPVQRGAGAARHGRLRDGHEAQGGVRSAANHLQGGRAGQDLWRRDGRTAEGPVR